MENISNEKVCVKCGDGDSINQLDQVGAFWKEASGKQHPINTLIIYAEKSKSKLLTETLKSNKENNVPTFKLRNISRRQKQPEERLDRRKSVRLEYESFDFKTQSFYLSCIMRAGQKTPESE